MIECITIELTDEMIKRAELEEQKINRVRMLRDKIKERVELAVPLEKILVEEYNEALNDLRYCNE